MKLFLDTNVLLDHALARASGERFEAKFLLAWALENEIQMYISAGSLYAFTYLLQRGGLRGDELKSRIKLYLQFIKVAQTDAKCFLESLQSDFKDLEDAFQHHTATREQCDYLLTNNVKDFKYAKDTGMKVITTSDFLTKVLKKKKGIDYQ